MVLLIEADIHEAIEMDKRSSNTAYDRLMRQAIAQGRAATQTTRGNTASSGNALSFMDWANATADREGEGLRSPPTGRGRRMGMGKGRGTMAPPVVRTLEDQHRLGEGPGALILEVHTNPNMTGMAMRKPTRRKTSVGFLTVIIGGKG